MDSTFAFEDIETSQLLKALVPFQWLCAISGIALPPPLTRNIYGNRQQKVGKTLLFVVYIIYIFMLIFLLMWMVHSNNVIVDVMVKRYSLDGVTKIMGVVQNFLVALVQLSMSCTALCGRNKSIRIFQHIALLEKDMLRYQRNFELRLKLENKLSFSQRCSLFNGRLLFRCGLFLVLHYILLCYTKFPLIWDSLPMTRKFLTLFLYHSMHMKNSEYRIMARLVNEFVSSIQDSLENLKYDLDRLQNVGGRIVEDSRVYAKLKSNQFILSRVWLLVQYIEEYYYLPMLCLYLYNGLNITHTINWMYIRSFERNDKDTKQPCKQNCTVFYLD